MQWVDLRTGYACNNRCRFCDQGDRRDTFVDASVDALREVLLGAGVPRDSGVWLAGGEVTLRRDLPALIRMCREVGFTRVGIQTNGRILAAAGAAEALQRLGLTDASVAIHAPGAVIHDHLSGVAGAFQQSVAGARRVVDAGIALHIATVITRSTTEVLPAIAALVVRLGARSHRWITARAQGAAVVEERALVPRYALLAGPLAVAVALERHGRVEPESVGVPFCILPNDLSVVGDRLDLPRVRRVFPPGLEEQAPTRGYGPPCEGCRWRAACPGGSAAYVARWGWGELGDRTQAVTEGAAQLGAPAEARVQVDGPEGVVPSRRLRQEMVAAASDLTRALVFVGVDPWAHPALPALMREAERLGFTSVGVRGPGSESPTSHQGAPGRSTNGC